MHGIIFAELRKYVNDRLGGQAWASLLGEAGMADRIFMPVEEYPDRDAVTLVTTAARLTGRPAAAILEDFGRFIAPDLLRMYSSLLDRQWRTLDVIEHTEETIHRVVRTRNPGARPPELRCERPGPAEVVVHYSSPRKMCAVAKGIARGLADHFKEEVTIEETSCMHAGAPECRIVVRRGEADPRRRPSGERSPRKG